MSLVLHRAWSVTASLSSISILSCSLPYWTSDEVLLTCSSLSGFLFPHAPHCDWLCCFGTLLWCLHPSIWTLNLWILLDFLNCGSRVVLFCIRFVPSKAGSTWLCLWLVFSLVNLIFGCSSFLVVAVFAFFRWCFLVLDWFLSVVASWFSLLIFLGISFALWMWLCLGSPPVRFFIVVFVASWLCQWHRRCSPLVKFFSVLVSVALWLCLCLWLCSTLSF